MDGEEWFVLCNPRVTQSLNVSLVHQFNHESVVCCVRFSKDGMLARDRVQSHHPDIRYAHWHTQLHAQR